MFDSGICCEFKFPITSQTLCSYICYDDPMTDQPKFTISALDRAFRHSLRRYILVKTMGSEKGIGPKEIADETEEKLGNISYHFKELRESGLIQCVGTEPRRGAVAHFYKAAPGLTPKIEAEAALDSLAELLESDQEIVENGNVISLAAKIVEIVRATGRPILLGDS